MKTILLSGLWASIWAFLVPAVAVLGVFLAGLTYRVRARRRAKRQGIKPRFNAELHGEFCQN